MYKLVKNTAHRFAEFYNKNEKKIAVILATTAIVLCVGTCATHTGKDDLNQEQQTTVQTINDEFNNNQKSEPVEVVERENIPTEITNNTEENEVISNNTEEHQNPETINETESNSYINDYIEDLTTGFKEIKDYAKDKWNSETVQTKLDTYKTKLKKLLNFVFNGEEINGITFSDLSTEAKANVLASITELDEWIEYYFPEYKDRIYNKLVGIGASGVELWNNIKELFSSYSSDVLSELDSRNGAVYTLHK